jgi:outer membrane receptor protein involved in Fe transport
LRKPSPIITPQASLDQYADAVPEKMEKAGEKMSAGASYRWGEMFVTVDGMYGSGLRAGFANMQHSPNYTQFNAAVGRNFYPWGSAEKPLTLRLSAINLFDRVYLLRSATGVGEFAPQWGPRRGIFGELTQQF